MKTILFSVLLGAFGLVHAESVMLADSEMDAITAGERSISVSKDGSAIAVAIAIGDDVDTHAEAESDDFVSFSYSYSSSSSGRNGTGRWRSTAMTEMAKEKWEERFEGSRSQVGTPTRVFFLPFLPYRLVEFD